VPLRYARQEILLGASGQQKLSDARVLVIGAGGLGSACLPYLVSAGLGNIGIIDGDTVGLSNLQRQVIFKEKDLGLNKATAAKANLLELNSSIRIDAISQFFTEINAIEIASGYDLLIDCSDRFTTKYLINDVSEILNLPLVTAAVHKFEGQLSVHNFNGSATYRDLFPEPPPADMAPTCEQEGVLGALVGVLGALQALEAIKILTLPADVPVDKLFVFDGLSLKSQLITYTRDTARPKISQLINYDQFCGIEKTLRVSDLPHLGLSYTLIDVRSSAEHLAGNSGGINIPLHSLEAGAQLPILKNTLVLYCQSGQRARQAKQLLASKYGLVNVFVLEL
jgi:sulfur-carrier protein adenylyltransferase/sulfurtransferase